MTTAVVLGEVGVMGEMGEVGEEGETGEVEGGVRGERMGGEKTGVAGEEILRNTSYARSSRMEAMAAAEKRTG